MNREHTSETFFLLAYTCNLVLCEHLCISWGAFHNAGRVDAAPINLGMCMLHCILNSGSDALSLLDQRTPMLPDLEGLCPYQSKREEKGGRITAANLFGLVQVRLAI